MLAGGEMGSYCLMVTVSIGGNKKKLEIDSGDGDTVNAINASILKNH